MPRRWRSSRRLLLGAAALGAAALAAVALADRRPPRALLPDGAVLALELSGAEGILERLEDTRFAAAFVAGPGYEWLERSEAVRSIDELRAGIGSATGFTPRRGHLLALAGREAAAAWYPVPAGGVEPLAASPWLVAGRLSWQAWPLAAAARLALRFGLAGDISCEQVAGTTVCTTGSGKDAIHLAVAGRLLVAANDRGLITSAARLAAGEGEALVEAAAWQRVFSLLPPRGELRIWARGDLIPAWARPAPRVPARAAGAVLAAGKTVEVDVFFDAPDGPVQRGGADAPPTLSLGGPAPLFFHAATGPAPGPLLDFLGDRAAAVARRGSAAVPQLPPLGSGFALALTSAEEGGLFPRPHGILAVQMRDADAARQALRLLFPAGARSAAGRWGTALSTRESFPLAGEFELWGAAAGERLVLATQQALVEGLGAIAAPGSGGPGAGPYDGGPLDSVTTLNVTKLLPALRRYAPPLAGLLRARYRGAPDLSRDLELAAAVRAVAVTTSTSAAGTRARITLQVGDLPATR
jgi:hypothetical protein